MSRKRRKGPAGGGRPVQHLGTIVSQGNSRVVRTGEDLDLGDLGGEVRQPLTARFTYFGHRFRANPYLTELAVVDLLEIADKIDVTSPKSMTFVKDYVREHIHPDDFDEFWKVAHSNGQDTSALMTTCWTLLDKITGNPTGGQSDSSAGQPETRTSSPSPSNERVTDLSAERERREPKKAAYLHHLKRLEEQRGEDGEPIPVNAAIQLQLIAQARGQGIDLEADLPSATATG